MIRTLFLLLICILSVGAVRADSPSTIRIGWIGPLTGNAASLGVDSVEAVKMAFEAGRKSADLNLRSIELIVENDEYIAAKTVAAYERLVHQQGIRVLFIINYSGLMALAKRAQRDGVLIINPIDCDESIAALPANVICVSQMSEEIGTRSVEDAAKRGLTPNAILYYASDAFFVNIARVSEKRLVELGHSPLVVEGYQRGDTDFRSFLSRVKKMGTRSIFFFGYDELGAAMRQAREQGISAQFYGTATMLSKPYQDSAGKSINGTIFSVWKPKDSPQYAEFLKRFEARTSRLPILDVCTVPSYDVANLIVSFFRSRSVDVETTNETYALQEFFYTVKDYQGASGPITIDADGATRTFVVDTFRINDRKVDKLYD